MTDTGTSVYVNEFEGHLVGSVQVELSDEVLTSFRDHLLESVQRVRPRGIIIDVSAVPFMDIQEFTQLRSTLNMAALMGGRPILVGLQPGVVAALVEMDADTDGLETAISVEKAVQRLRLEEIAAVPPPDSDEESGGLPESHDEEGDADPESLPDESDA